MPDCSGPNAPAARPVDGALFSQPCVFPGDPVRAVGLPDNALAAASTRCPHPLTGRHRGGTRAPCIMPARRRHGALRAFLNTLFGPLPASSARVRGREGAGFLSRPLGELGFPSDNSPPVLPPQIGQAPGLPARKAPSRLSALVSHDRPGTGGDARTDGETKCGAWAFCGACPRVRSKLGGRWQGAAGGPAAAGPPAPRAGLPVALFPFSYLSGSGRARAE